ncbi:hypothetical protein DPMN_057518 [Dreissena polymorpha]|uniref:Uncharacterized protein n=1 Tax=Dreissena polymorpha TaxID=45954 RepID=A0A9D4C0C3_DREPO|nr:hypothetical protein DPMN_057518 [Dreissena polymorpha]
MGLNTQESDEDVVSLPHVLLHPRSVVNSIVVIIAARVCSVLDPTLEPHLREVSKVRVRVRVCAVLDPTIEPHLREGKGVDRSRPDRGTTSSRYQGLAWRTEDIGRLSSYLTLHWYQQDIQTVITYL